LKNGGGISQDEIFIDDRVWWNEKAIQNFQKFKIVIARLMAVSPTIAVVSQKIRREFCSLVVMKRRIISACAASVNCRDSFSVSFATISDELNFWRFIFSNYFEFFLLPRELVRQSGRVRNELGLNI